MNVIGSDIESIQKLTGNGDLECVVIPGLVRLSKPELTYQQLLEYINDNHHDLEEEAIKHFNIIKTKIDMMYRKTGMKLEIRKTLLWDIKVVSNGFSFRARARAILNDFKDEIKCGEDDEELYCMIPKARDKESERVTIHNLARQMSIPVNISDEGVNWCVVYRSETNKHPKATTRNVLRDIHFWLSTLKPMVPLAPPREIIQACTDSYFRTVINKSPYHASYRRGLVTVYPAGITGGKLHIGTKPLAPVDSTCSTRYLDMVLAPHGLDHTSVMNWERLCRQGGDL